jgi:hypothetical protein
MKLNTYIGLRAIAYVLTEGEDIIKYGIKRVNVSFDDYYEFIAGLPVSKRINRRMKAQARRNLWRYKSRRNNLLRLLEMHFGCKPQHLTRTENLQLRVKGLTEKLSNQELVNVLMQLQKKRGYKSLRGVNDSNSDYLKEIERHEEELKQYPSLAAYLLTMDSSKNVIVTRKSYEREFNKIMDRQQIDEKLRKKIFDIIYYQRPLKKPKVARCKYESNRSVCHASNPIYQTFRIWRDVMNIVIYDAEKNELEISFEQRKRWFEKCNAGKNLTKASCLKDLGIKRPAQYTWYSGKVIAGNPINKVFSELKIEADYYELWQDIYSATDNERLGRLLADKYKLSDTVINELLDLDFNKLGWSDYSMKAIRKLLPLMQQGKRLKEAILDVYGKVAMGEVALRNVVLEQHFESYKALVEQLKSKYPITEYQFEIDHLLKQSNKGRKEIAQSRRKEEKLAKQYPELSQYDRIKLQLWEESGGISPYEPDVIIDRSQLFTDQYNIDHIVPKSKLFERSMTNQVLCRAELNKLKDRMTGLDFAKHLGIEEAYRKAVEKFPESKKELLLMSEADIPTDWLSRRQNSDYNTRCFATIGNAVNIPNKLISRYMKEWKVDSYGEQDARHYLCKAWVMANMSQDTVNYFDSIKQHSESNDSVSVYAIQPALASIDFENAPVFIPRIKFVRKTKFGFTPRFALHKESMYGRREIKSRNAKGEIVEQEYFKIRQPVSKLTEAMIPKIMDKAIREKIQARIAEKSNHEDGILSLIENPITHNGKPVKRVSVAQNAEKIFALHSTDGSGRTYRYKDFERKIDYVFSDKNYCLKVWIDEKGKVKKEAIALIQHIDQLNEGKTIEPSFMLFENDIIELNGRRWFVVGAAEALSLRPIHILSATDTHKIKADEWLKIKKVEVNQLGETLRSYGIENCKQLSLG